jgi:hypothetical protein
VFVVMGAGGIGRAVAWLLLASFAVASRAAAQSDAPVVTVVADFEDDSIAASIGAVRNVLAADCSARWTALPARGQRSLAVSIAAAEADSSAVCDLRMRLATLFARADRVATYCWLEEGQAQIAFRIRDARGRLFESPLQDIAEKRRWTRLEAELKPGRLRPVADGPAASQSAEPLAWPIEIAGFRVATRTIGRQTVFLDDLEVEHPARPQDVVRGEFRFDHPTKIYEPYSTMGVAVVLENCSRRDAIRASVQLVWLRPDGSELKTQTQSVNLLAAGKDFRSRQALDFSQRVEQPGFYTLVARVRGEGWTGPRTFETGVAVMPSNRSLPRGRSTNFGVRSDLLAHPLTDQLLEIEAARELGVQVVAIDTPWPLIEPKPGQFEFAALDPLVEAMNALDIAPLIALVEQPVWLDAQSDRLARRVSLVEALASHFGARVRHYQFDVAALDAGREALSSALVGAQKRIARIDAESRVLSPPIQVDAQAPPLDVAIASEAGPQLVLATRGPSGPAAAALRGFADANRIALSRAVWWRHEPPSPPGIGFLSDAIDVFGQYIRAGEMGVSGLIWTDLRDGTDDPRYPERQHGLLRRDFSPKAPMLGYANAVGMLSGLRYAGPLLGAPDEYASALYIGSSRQVAVLIPPANRVRPALLSPFQGVPGQLRAYDFERREQRLLDSPNGALVQTTPGPMFIALELNAAQPEPQVALRQPWLRAPATVFYGADAGFTIEIDAPVALQKSYVQIDVPKGAPFESSVTAKALKAKAGEALSVDVHLKPRATAASSTTQLGVNLSLEGKPINVTLEALPLVGMKPAGQGTSLTDPRFDLGPLLSGEPNEKPGSARVHGAYGPEQVQLAVRLPDSIGPGDSLRIGLVAENTESLVEVQISNLGGAPAIEPLPWTDNGRAAGWECSRLSGPTICCRIPAQSIGLSRIEGGQRLLAAVVLISEQNAARVKTWSWGSGLNGSRRTDSYRWIVLERGGGS